MCNLRLEARSSTPFFLGCESFEKGLNFAGRLPIVSVLSGSLRALYGVARAVSGLALAVLFYLKPCYSMSWDDGLNCAISLRECQYALWNIIKGLSEPFLLGSCIDHFSGMDLYIITKEDCALE